MLEGTAEPVEFGDDQLDVRHVRGLITRRFGHGTAWDLRGRSAPAIGRTVPRWWEWSDRGVWPTCSSERRARAIPRRPIALVRGSRRQGELSGGSMRRSCLVMGPA